MKFDVAIPAGGEVRPDRIEGMGTRYKALADVNGTPLLARTIEMLRRSPHVGRIALVASEPVLEALGELADVTGEDTGSGPGNMLRGFELLEATDRVLVTGCDAPLLRPQVVADLVERAPRDAAICFSWVRANAFAQTYPECPFLNIRLRGGSGVGGTLHLAHAPSLLAKRAPLQAAFEARKHPLEMLRMLGVAPVPLYVLGLLSAEAIARRASEILGIPCVDFESPFPEIAFDVDKPEHLEVARAMLA